MSDNENTILKQSFNGGARYLEILDEEKLILRQRKGQNKSQHIISLLALDADGRKIFHAKWIYSAFGIVIPSILVLYAMLGKPGTTQQIIFTVLSILVFCLGVYLFTRSFSRQYVFETRHSKIPVVELSINKPNKEEFEEFKNQIIERIINIQDTRNISANDLLAGEMRMLRRLEGEKLIDKKVYEKAKAKLLNLFVEKPGSASED